MTQTDSIGYFIIILINALILLYSSNGLYFISSMFGKDSNITRTIGIGGMQKLLKILIPIFTIINIACVIKFIEINNTSKSETPSEETQKISNIGLFIAFVLISTIITLYLVISNIYRNYHT